jgi:WD40 repeat protein
VPAYLRPGVYIEELSDAYTPTQLASGADDRTVRVWDAATGAELRALAGHDDWVRSVAWSPDGTRVASGADDGTVRVWDAATGTELRALAGHDGGVNTVAWSPDGTQLASGADDGTLRVWDGASNGALFGVMGGEVISTVGYSRKGDLALGVGRSLIVYRPSAKDLEYRG